MASIQDLKPKILTLMAVKDRLMRVVTGDLEKKHRSEVEPLLEAIVAAEKELHVAWATLFMPDKVRAIKTGELLLPAELENDIAQQLGLINLLPCPILDRGEAMRH